MAGDISANMKLCAQIVRQQKELAVLNRALRRRKTQVKRLQAALRECQSVQRIPNLGRVR